MQESEDLSRLIADIYDAALVPCRWQKTVEQAARFVGGSGAALFSKDIAARDIKIFYVWNVAQPYVDSYFSKYVKIDPQSVHQFGFGVGEVYCTSDYISYQEFQQTQIYREWTKPQGWYDLIATTLDKTITGFSTFGVFRNRNDGVVDEAARRRMRLVVPHLQRATSIGAMFDATSSEAAALADAFDGLATATFIVRSNGTIVFANAIGEAMLEERVLLRSDRKVIGAVNPNAAAALRSALAAAQLGDASLGTNGIAIALSAGEERWLLDVLPLTSGRRRASGSRYEAAAALFVRRASLELTSPIQTIASLYNLSPSEMRVLAIISDSGGVAATASILGLSDSTVKTHLQHVFRKTATTRQADLVKLIASHASVLRAPPATPGAGASATA